MRNIQTTTDVGVRERLMRSAERLLAASEDGEISTRAICAGASVTAPTLYHHFADKGALLDAVILEGFTSYLERKRSLIQTQDVREAFRLGWDMHVSFGCEHPAQYRLMFGNPLGQRLPPAASVAHAELVRTAAEWDRKGSLVIPVDVATATMSAAAVGVTLELITRRAKSVDPISLGVRDAVARALFDVPREGAEAPIGVAQLARRLVNELPDAALAPLGAAETALLREWLHAISDSSNNGERKTR